MSYRIKIPKLNNDNLQAWQELTKLHLVNIRDTCLKYPKKKYVAPVGPLSMYQIMENKSHNIMMVDIASTLNYDEFDEVKDCPTTHEMWIKMKDIYRGDENVQRVKTKILRDQFDQMKMREDEKKSQYNERIKKV